MNLVGIGAAHFRVIWSQNAAEESLPSLAELVDANANMQMAGAAFQACAQAAKLGAKAHLLSLRGGDPVGDRIEEQVQSAGIEDHSITFLTRESPYEIEVEGPNGSISRGSSFALYERRFPSQIKRRALRDLLANAQRILIDEQCQAASILQIAELCAGKELHAVVSTMSEIGEFAPVKSRLECLTLDLSAYPPFPGVEPLQRLGAEIMREIDPSLLLIHCRDGVFALDRAEQSEWQSTGLDFTSGQIAGAHAVLNCSAFSLQEKLATALEAVAGFDDTVQVMPVS